MAATFTLYRGGTLLADDRSLASGFIGGRPLSDVVRQMTEVQRPRAAAVAVVDMGNVSTSVRFTVAREFTGQAASLDHAFRGPQTALGQHDLVIVFNDGTDVHTWTLSDVNGDGAAWKAARTAQSSGVSTALEYTVTGGVWTYSGPFPSTYDDSISSGGVDTLTPAVRRLLALPDFCSTSGEMLMLDGRAVAGALVFGGSALAGMFGVMGSTALTSLRFDALTSLGGTARITGCAALVTLTMPLLASVGGTLDIHGNSSLTALAFAALTYVPGTMGAWNLTALTSLTFPVFALLPGSLDLSGNTALTSLSLAALTSLAGSLNVSGGTALVTLTVAASIGTSNGFTFNASGCALNTASVDAILAAFAAGLGGTTSGTIDLSGGTNASPTGGTGNADYLTLTGAGLTVNIN